MPGEFDNQPPRRCVHCRRPAVSCYCDLIPQIDNKTAVTILQHRRERFHPFNTARIVARSLNRCQLISDHTRRMAQQFDATELLPSAGILYPSDDAVLLSDMAPEDRPKQIVVLDGTWHHAKTMMRDIPKLQGLRRFGLRPAQPGRYRIRREPNEFALSTLEATVAALSVLEPSTVGFDGLIGVFDSMIGNQLKNPKSNWRQNANRRRGSANIPRVLQGPLGRIVVAYGERERGGKRYDRKESAAERRTHAPVHWVAQRLTTDSKADSSDRFECTIESQSWLDSSFRDRTRISNAQVAEAVSVEEFAKQWTRFLQPNDVLVVFHPSTARLIANVTPHLPPATVLKSICLADGHKTSTLEDFLQSQGIVIDGSGKTRAAVRLARAIAFVHYLNKLS